MEDSGHERDRGQDGYSQAPVSRRSFVVGVAAAGAAATAARALPGRAAVPGSGTGRAAVSMCGSLSRAKASIPGGELTDAAFVSADEWWAVGNVGAALHANRTRIMRFDGSAWSAVASPNQGTLNNGLNGVSMTGGGGWAVGFYQAAGYQPLALQWDGTAWSLNSPAAFPSDSVFTDVDTLADGTAWAVGFQTTKAGARSTLIEHASGGTWTPVASPNVAGSDSSLVAVAGTAATGLWAVGYWLSPMGLQPLVLRYDTTKPSPSWVLVGGVPAPGQVDTVLAGVDVLSASDVWAVGYCNDGGADRPVALHWDGSSWSSSTVPGAGLLRQVRAVASGNVWAAGSYYNASLQQYQTLVVQFDGTAWTTVVSADSKTADYEVIGLALDPAGSALTLVGRAGSNALIEQASCPSGPVSLPTRAPAPLPPLPPAPGVGPAPSPPPNTPPAQAPIPVTITDQAAAAGIGGQQDWSFSAAVADLTGDGWPDLFVSHHWHPANLWTNNQDGTFSAADVSFFSTILDRHDCQAADFNQDGSMDIFSSVGADRGTALKCNGLFIQQPDGSFTDVAYQWNIGDATGRGRFCAVLDANNDGFPDVFYGTDPVRADGLPSINRFYRNTGQGSFIDSPAMGLNLNIGALSARTVDYDCDGWPDLLICGYTGGLRLFKNNQGHGFSDVSSILGPSINAVDAVMVDVNHDNRPDLIVLTKTAVKLIRQNADGTFAKPKTILTVSNAVALAVGDVNGDNNPDIYVVCGKTGTANAQDFLLIGDATGGFTSQAIPQTTAGSGERAFPIDYNHSGLTSFLVLNGAVPSTGPIQLLTPQPSADRTLPS